MTILKGINYKQYLGSFTCSKYVEKFKNSSHAIYWPTKISKEQSKKHIEKEKKNVPDIVNLFFHKLQY